MARYRTTEIAIEVTDRGMLALSRAALQVIREQCAASLDKHGKPFPAGRGEKKRLDMVRSGRMLDDIEVFSGSLRARAPYAQAVDNRFGWFGVAPRSLPRLEELAAGVLRSEIRGR